MPHYDDSFILDDNANQRRNKRSYHVYKQGHVEPSRLIQTNLIKNNIKNLTKPDVDVCTRISYIENLFAERLITRVASQDELDNLKNNNYCFNGKSLENLGPDGIYARVRIRKKDNLRNVVSLYNVHDDDKFREPVKFNHSECALKKDFYSYSVNDLKEPPASRYARRVRTPVRNASKCLEAGIYRKINSDTDFDAKVPQNTTQNKDEESDTCNTPAAVTPSSGSSGHRGSLRGANKLARRARSFKDDLLERISNMRAPVIAGMPNALPGSPANNVALRSQSPLSPRSRGSSGTPGRVTGGSASAAQSAQGDEDHNPSKDLELLVRQVRFDLKYFCDVISKKTLEMLPGNGTLILDTITNIQTAIRPYVAAISLPGAANSSGLNAALARLCEAVARLIRLCDEALLSAPSLMQGTGSECSSELDHLCPALRQENVNEVVGGVQSAVEELSRLALSAMCGRPALAPRSALTTGNSVPPVPHHSTPPPHNTHANTNNTQRNSLPDIPLTPRERQSLGSVSGGSEGKGRSTCAIGMPSRSTDSIVDAVSVEDNRPVPPPKPPRPDRMLDIAPPLPPKKKGTDNTFLGLSAIDRMSLQSHSSGSLDSMLNVSNDEEIRVIMEQNSSNLDDSSVHHLTSDILAICSCPSAEGFSQSRSNRVSMDSTSTNQSSSISAERPPSDNTPILNANSSGSQKTGEEPILHNSTSNTVNQNRLSNESGFVSMGNTRCSEISYSSFNSTQRSIGFSETNTVMGDVLADGASINHKQVINNGVLSSFEMSSSSTQEKSSFKTESLTVQNMSHTQSSVSQTAVRANIDITIDGSSMEVPPALPAKTRRAFLPAALQANQPPSLDVTDFHNIEFRDHVKRCAVHGHSVALEMTPRPHTLMDPPPPLPLKKKHIMAYMEMFGNCSHPPATSIANVAAANAAELYRHSIHTYNLSSHQHHQVMSQNKQLHMLHSGPQLSQSHAMHHFNTISASHFSPRVSPQPLAPPPVAPPILPPALPPALPPKMSKLRPVRGSSPARGTVALSASVSPRIQSPAETSLESSGTENHVNISDSVFEIFDVSEVPPESPSKPGRFPVDDAELQAKSEVGDSLSSSPLPDGDLGQEADIILEEDVSNFLVLKENADEGPEIRGGHPDALIVHATKASKDFGYQEAFLATYRTFVTPYELVCRLARRHAALTSSNTNQSTLAITGRRREVQALLARVVSDLTTSDLDGPLLELILEFVYGLVCSGDLAMAKALRVIILEKYGQQQSLSVAPLPMAMVALTARRETLLDFKSAELAEQMTLLDAALFTRIAVAEVLAWTREQSEDRSPNLTRFTEHFNKMSYWARSRILEQEEAKDREKYVIKFIKVMKHLRKINNFNSYLALLSALDSAPVRRLEWPRHVGEALADYCALIDSSSSFRAYRQALADTHPPCIPYIGLVLQDLTFVHIGNSDLLPNGAVNFSKRWQQYHIVENMKRFYKGQYKFEKNERIIAMFNVFDDVLSEEAMWQISETIKPRGGRNKKQQNSATANGTVAVHDG